MLTIYLLRHGETEWNADGNRYCGRTDLPLTDKGIEQANAVYLKMRDIGVDAVYSSPLQRAFHTARIVSGKEEVMTDERLIETDFGQWEGKSKADFIAENPQLWQAWRNDPTEVQAGGTGETAGSVVRRVDDFFRSLLKTNNHKTLMVVAHNGVNRLYLSYKLGMPLRNYQKFFLDNASVSKFTLDEQGELTLHSLNI